MRWATLLRVVGIGLLLLAGMILLAGAYLTVIGAVSFGEYADPPPSIWAKLRDVFPVALWTIVAAAIPATLGAVLIASARRRRLIPSHHSERTRAKKMMRRTIGLFVATQVLVGLLAACDRSSTEPPWGLDDVTQPADEASVLQVLESMPAFVDGRERSGQPDPLRVSYGEGDATLRAIRLGEAAEAEGFPGTAGEFLQMLAQSGEIEPDSQRIDRRGLMFIVSIETPTEVQPEGTTVDLPTEYVIGWGEPDSEWMFTVSADSPQMRVAVVEAFVDTVLSTE